MNHKVLVVEDSRTLAALIKKRLVKDLDLEVDLASSLEETKNLLAENREEPYLMAVLDLNLPDAPNGEVVDFVASKDIPSVVLTGTFDEKIRHELYSKNIIDYLIKEGGRDLDLIVTTIRRLRRNADSKILVVDDSRFSRQYLIRLLRRQHYEVLAANDGRQAMNILENETGIKLVIADYNMPNMDGHELTAQLRKKYGMDSMAIIGVSASDENYLTAKFIKMGANDFLKKPFSVEEFYCRVNQNLELVNLIKEIKDAGNTDYLTRLYNRRYFFDLAPRVYDRAKHDNTPLAVAMLDIDHFKKINDTYGHDAGDLALIMVARLLKNSFRPSDILARFGGEEFCVLMHDVNVDQAVKKLDQLRMQIGEIVVEFEEHIFQMTMSIGMAYDYGTSLPAMIKQADEHLYLAKTGGRNRVVHQS